ncbi:MAG: peptidylprolyl isomerase, partial [Sphingobacteriaceae bacterium]
MKKYISAIALLLAIFSASAQQITKNGVGYTIISNGSGEKAKVDDVIMFNVEQRTSTDSLLFSSYKVGKPIQIRVKPSQNMMDLMDIFVLMSAGDSAVVTIPTDSIFKGREDERPQFIAKGTDITTKLKLVKIQTMAGFMAERTAELEKLKAAEAAEAGEYIITNKLNPITTASGLKYIITTPSAKPKGKNTDTVLVNYTGRTLEGKVFDSSVA